MYECITYKVKSCQILYISYVTTNTQKYKITTKYHYYTVGTESIQTPLNFSLFVILQPFAKII